MNQIADAAGRDVNIRRQLTGRDAHGPHEVLQQNFTGVDFIEQFSHVAPLVVVHDFDLIGAIGVPDKADTPLVIDADAVLSFAVPLERFQMVAGGNPQACQFRGRLQLQKLAPRHAFDVLESGNRLAMKQRLGLNADERVNHGASYSAMPSIHSTKSDLHRHVIVRWRGAILSRG